MKIGTYHHHRCTVVAPRDAIVAGECDDLRRVVTEVLAGGSNPIVLDLSEVPFLDSAALELLCELQVKCADGGAPLRLASLGEVCKEILRITDLAGQFQTFDSVEEAAQSLE